MGVKKKWRPKKSSQNKVGAKKARTTRADVTTRQNTLIFSEAVTQQKNT